MPMKISNLLRGKKQKPAADSPTVVRPLAAAPAPAAMPLPAAVQTQVAAQSPVARSAGEVEQAVIEVLRTVFDPEIPVNIYEMGLVYEIDADAGGRVLVRMTLTSPGCPVAGSLMPEVERKIAAVPGVTDVYVELVWDPPWDPSRMSDAAKLQLGMF
jgi:FeS assembly SUF system protein